MATLKLSKVRWICKDNPGLYVTWNGRQVFAIFKNGQLVRSHTEDVTFANPGRVDVAMMIASGLMDRYLEESQVSSR
jgi:hypothetical protein